MAQLLFDAISATRRLKSAGFVPKQAEAVVQTVTQANSLTLQLVQDLADLKAHVTQNMVTKAFLTETLNQYDLKNMVVKDDLRGFATKDDLRGFATKDDLRGFATKDDLRGFATKDDINAGAARSRRCRCPAAAFKWQGNKRLGAICGLNQRSQQLERRGRAHAL